MKIKWLGHAAFLITASDGTRIITDPYHQRKDLTYGNISERADIVTISHDHSDHNNVAAVPGKPQVVKGPGSHEAKGIEFQGIASYHDESKGKERGPNTIFCFTVDGLRLCHLGDLGQLPTPEQASQIGPVDILFIPVGGFYTIDSAAATDVYSSLKPRITIPMHFKNPKCDFPITGVEDFVKGKPSVQQAAGSEVEITKDKLPPGGQIIVLKPAL